MRIAQLATNVERVPPDGYGGTELVVSLLTEELVRRGHEVSLFATGDSKTKARLVSVIEAPLRTNTKFNLAQWAAFDIQTLIKLEDMQDQFDIIHSHMGWQALPMLDKLKTPSVSTNHNPLKDYCAPIYKAYRNLPYVAISNRYRELNYGDELNYIDTVYNGIPCDDFGKHPQRKRDYLLFIGRLDRDKGAAEALDIARRLNIPLKMAGKIDPISRDFFEQEIKPRLEWNGAEYVGEVDYQRKLELYEGAIAVIYPINFDEPFGLVMVEALASGTPVVALNRGAVPEVLSDGETAVVGQTVDELVARFEQVKTIDPELCKKRVRERFSVERMVDGYMRVYERILSGARTVPLAEPVRRSA